MGDNTDSTSIDGGRAASADALRQALLDAASDNREIVDSLVPELYGQLRAMAHNRLRRERQGHTLSTTALVHEAYIRLSRLDRYTWRNRAQFSAEAARAMRRILVDHAERRGARKRGGDRVRVELAEDLAMTEGEADELLAVHRAIEALERIRERAARVVECRFFAGMTVPETAEALAVSPATVKRDWDIARAWLNRELSASPSGAGQPPPASS